jgi:uncharacterized cupin superfamily protein
VQNPAHGDEPPDRGGIAVAVAEAQLDETAHGLVCTGAGWFVANARDLRWFRTGEARISNFGGDTRFEQLGISIEVLGPGEPMACYHREWNQEGFLVVRGSGTLVVEGEERPLREWDFFHCPPGVAHVIVGGPIAVVAVGARQDDDTEYVADPVAAKHGASPARTTTDAREAYEGWERPTHTRYDGWLE